MKRLNLLSTVVATLLLTAGAASAQTVKKDEAPAHAPATQQKAPAEKVAPPMLRNEHKAQATPDMKPAEHKVPQTTGQMTPKTPEPGKSQMKAQTMDKGAEQHRAANGPGAAAGSAKLSSEQRTKITSIIHEHKAAPVHLNMSVRVGTRVPPSVHFYPLPVEVVAIYPEWRGYDYILVGDEIVIVDPRTHEIVAIMEA